MDARANSRFSVALIAIFGVALSLVALPIRAQRGAISSPQGLADMVDQAGVIVRGHVLSAHAEPLPQFSSLWTIVVTVQVEESLKGQTGDTYTFRQFIWDPRDRADAAGYAKGGNLLLLLLTPNAQGLSSPVGMEQGRFQLRSDASGSLVAVNGRNNAGLFSGVPSRANTKGILLAPRLALLAAAPAPGPVALNDLRELILQFAEAK